MSWSCSLPTVLANDTRDWSGRRLAEEGSLEGQKCRSWLDLRSFLLWPPAKSKHLKADLDIYNMSKTCPHVIYCNLWQSIAIYCNLTLWTWHSWHSWHSRCRHCNSFVASLQAAWQILDEAGRAMRHDMLVLKGTTKDTTKGTEAAKEGR